MVTLKIFFSVIHFYKNEKNTENKVPKRLLVLCIQIPISVTSLCLTYFSQSPVMLKHLIQKMPVCSFLEDS